MPDPTREQETTRLRLALAREFAHAIRSPLTVLRGYLELALESPAESETFLRQALAAAEAIERTAANMAAGGAAAPRRDEG